jgi:hypothetical protein
MITTIAPGTIQQADPISAALSSLSASALSSLLVTADELVRKELETFRGLFFICLVAATVLVLVGVALEEAHDWMPYVHHILRLDPIVEYRLSKKLVTLGWLLILVGVGGEFIFEVYVNRADSILSGFDNILLTDARKKAGDAAKSATIAHEEAGAASLEADTAKASAKAVAEKATQLDQQLATTGKKLDAVESRRAELEKSLVNLAICNAPRVLPISAMGNPTSNIWKTTVDPLRPFARDAIIEFVSDAENKKSSAQHRSSTT